MLTSIPIPADATTGAIIALPPMHKLINTAFLVIFIRYSFCFQSRSSVEHIALSVGPGRVLDASRPSAHFAAAKRALSHTSCELLIGLTSRF